MSKKADVVVLDLLMKNEAKHKDMLDIMTTLQDYFGENYPEGQLVLSGGDQLMCERQVGARRHMMDGNTAKERLELLKPVIEDWHCLVAFIAVSIALENRLKILDGSHICITNKKKVVRIIADMHMYSIHTYSTQTMFLNLN